MHNAVVDCRHLVWLTCEIKTKKPAGGPTVPTSSRGKKTIPQSQYIPIHAMVTMLSISNAPLRYDTVILCRWIIGCRQQLRIQNCGQTAADRDRTTIHSLQKLVIALSNGTITNPLRRTV